MQMLVVVVSFLKYIPVEVVVVVPALLLLYALYL